MMIMPLHDATANNAVLESLACGLPLVVSDVGAVRDYVNPEGTALIQPYDSQSMAQVVLDLFDSPHTRKAMSEISREQALNFCWPNVVRKLQDVYSEVA